MTSTSAKPRERALRSADRVGTEAAAGAVLFLAGVAMEWVLSPQQGSAGTVVRPAAFGFSVGTSLVGAGLLVRAGRGMKDLVPSTTFVRFGRATAVLGWALLLLGTVAVLLTGLLLDAPHAASFAPWVLGMLLVAVGAVPLGLGVRRTRPVVGWALVVAGLSALASLLVGVDPWHDVSLVAMCAAWVVAGLALRR